MHPQPVFHRLAAVFVRTMVGQRRIKLIEQIAVRRMNLYAVIPGQLRAAGRLSEQLFDLQNLILCKRTGRFLLQNARRGRDRLRAGDVPACIAAGMVDLRKHLYPFCRRMDSLCDGGKTLNRLILGNGNLPAAGLAAHFNIAVFRDDQPDFRVFRPRGIIGPHAGRNQAPVRLLGGHRRHDDSAPQLQIAHLYGLLYHVFCSFLSCFSREISQKAPVCFSYLHYTIGKENRGMRNKSFSFGFSCFFVYFFKDEKGGCLHE